MILESIFAGDAILGLSNPPFKVWRIHWIEPLRPIV